MPTKAHCSPCTLSESSEFTIEDAISTKDCPEKELSPHDPPPPTHTSTPPPPPPGFKPKKNAFGFTALQHTAAKACSGRTQAGPEHFLLNGLMFVTGLQACQCEAFQATLSLSEGITPPRSIGTVPVNKWALCSGDNSHTDHKNQRSSSSHSLGSNKLFV